MSGHYSGPTSLAPTVSNSPRVRPSQCTPVQPPPSLLRTAGQETTTDSGAWGRCGRRSGGRPPGRHRRQWPACSSTTAWSRSTTSAATCNTATAATPNSWPPTSAPSPKPATLTWEQAAALPLAVLTAYRAIVHALQVRDGDTLLLHGAAGGVGSLALQIALARGATVIGSDAQANRDYLASLGARPVGYELDLADQVRAPGIPRRQRRLRHRRPWRPGRHRPSRPHRHPDGIDRPVRPARHHPRLRLTRSRRPARGLPTSSAREQPWSFARLTDVLGAVAQSGSAPRSHRGGQGFKSPQLHPSFRRSEALRRACVPAVPLSRCPILGASWERILAGACRLSRQERV